MLDQIMSSVIWFDLTDFHQKSMAWGRVNSIYIKKYFIYNERLKGAQKG